MDTKFWNILVIELLTLFQKNKSSQTLYFWYDILQSEVFKSDRNLSLVSEKYFVFKVIIQEGQALKLSSFGSLQLTTLILSVDAILIETPLIVVFYLLLKEQILLTLALLINRTMVPTVKDFSMKMLFQVIFDNSIILELLNHKCTSAQKRFLNTLLLPCMKQRIILV